MGDAFAIAVDVVFIGHGGFLPLQNHKTFMDEETQVLRNDGLVDLDIVLLGMILRLGVCRGVIAGVIASEDGIFILGIGLRAKVVGERGRREHFDTFEFSTFGTTENHVTSEAIDSRCIP